MLLDFLSENLLLDKEYVVNVATTASNRYKKYIIKKRDGSDRVIHHPSAELKAIQRFLHERVLSSLPVHVAAYAYKNNIGLKEHVLFHAKNNFLTRIDFRNFFPSITRKDLESYFDKYGKIISSSWGADDTDLINNLVLLDNHLTIGAVTSPILSNCICIEMDEMISQYCGQNEISYTRYADDLYFSTNKRDVLFAIPSIISGIVKRVDYPKHLWINREKTIHTSRKRNRKITGVVLTSDGKASVGRDKKREIRSAVFRWDSLSVTEKKSLVGYLSYCRSIEPEFINSLCSKYGAAKISDILKYQ